MFNLHKASFIPQANSQKKEPELSDLVVVKKEDKKIEWDLMFLPEQNRWKIKHSFLANDLGYTAALQDGYLFLLQTGEDAVEILKPKFLKGLGNAFTSNYFNLLAVQAGFNIGEKCYLFLTEQETGIENVKAYLVTKELPEVVLPTSEETPVAQEPIVSVTDESDKIWEKAVPVNEESLF
jgi:hypothetical protein